MKNTYTDARCERLSRNTLDEGFLFCFLLVLLLLLLLVFFQDKLRKNSPLSTALRTAHCLVYLLQVETLNRYI